MLSCLSEVISSFLQQSQGDVNQYLACRIANSGFSRDLEVEVGELRDSLHHCELQTSVKPTGAFTQLLQMSHWASSRTGQGVLFWALLHRSSGWDETASGYGTPVVMEPGHRKVGSLSVTGVGQSGWWDGLVQVIRAREAQECEVFCLSHGDSEHLHDQLSFSLSSTSRQPMFFFNFETVRWRDPHSQIHPTLLSKCTMQTQSLKWTNKTQTNVILHHYMKIKGTSNHTWSHKGQYQYSRLHLADSQLKVIHLYIT